MCRAGLHPYSFMGSTESSISVNRRSSSVGNHSEECSPSISRTASPSFLRCSSSRTRSLSPLSGAPDDLNLEQDCGWKKLKGNVGGGFCMKSIRNCLRRSFDSLNCLSSPETMNPGLITIEILPASPIPTRKKTTKSRPEECNETFSESNISTSLFLSHLQDGLFCADIPLENIPTLASHVVVRIRNYSLDISVFASNSPGSRKSSAKPICATNVSLPIYVNPCSLQFRWNNVDKILQVRGSIKGSNCASQTGTSSSSGDLSLNGSRYLNSFLRVGGSSSSVYLSE